MEIVTLEYVIKCGDKKESVVLYFKDKQSAEKYKEEYLENDPNITMEDDCIGYQYYNDNDWYGEMNEMIVDQAWSRLNPGVPERVVVERVVDRVIEPDFYRVQYVNHNNKHVCKVFRSKEELNSYMDQALNVAVSGIMVTRMSLDQLVEEYENA